MNLILIHQKWYEIFQKNDGYPVAEDPCPFLGIVRSIGNICNCPRISPRMQPPTTSSTIINHRHPSAWISRSPFLPARNDRSPPWCLQRVIKWPLIFPRAVGTSVLISLSMEPVDLIWNNLMKWKSFWISPPGISMEWTILTHGATDNLTETDGISQKRVKFRHKLIRVGGKLSRFDLIQLDWNY